ncbi:MAG: fumarylacetoacetate hydrolase family protein [Actinobacteria bacterium]|nr:fumarylacetoacetate hydrolase family protein [Actinomycetota bacterium]MCZ6518517.1 fumarylacetoacetate hydrolase family protein [Actinomycetota bacterium]MCZ6566974.1 fumarylacetoacetate hydrolase family protein [Actinomycetota bacterium]MCZ6631107.1 fumarylacetoacetate hydrolase family protein [Actinomycetota bacterium]MCZ6737480.1 fumarylacetoacetate hydrolase family protein [Actinomycetota bacterium]
MKIVRMKAGDDIAYGVADAEGVVVYKGSPFVAWEPTETVVPWANVSLLSPVIPTKILCVGKNYEDHVEEMGGEIPAEPVIFMKPATAVVGQNAAVIHPRISKEVHHEAELAVVISRPARNISAEDASLYIFGYTAANDVTARDLQMKDAQWTRAKGFDTFCPLGPAIETELDPLERLAVICRVNGEVRQAGFTSDMIFGVAEILEYITAFTTLLPGDLVLTGTPAGASKVEPGDVMEIEIDGIGTLTNRLVSP